MSNIKIEEILLDNGLVGKAMLDDALSYQINSGVNMTQYLIAHGHLREEDLAKCISVQFGFPYLPLRAYDIPEYIVKLIPVDIVKKYLLMPVDRIENLLTLVMYNPLDDEAIKEVERATNCTVQPFIGMISDIEKAIEKYYGISVEYSEFKKAKKETPLFIADSGYSGAERRRSVRIKAKIDIHFSLQDMYKKAQTKDVSSHGFLFESANMLPIGSFLTIEVNVPREVSPHPLVGIFKVVRVMPLDSGKFDVGVELVDMAKENVEKITKYAAKLERGNS